MKLSTKGLVIAVLMGAAIAVYPTVASAWSHNEHVVNSTGATAYDVVKILDGDYEITDMMEWDFANHDYYHRTVGGKVQTVLRWWGGTVAAGDVGDVCFTAKPLGCSVQHAKIIGAWWTDENGEPLGNYYPALSLEIDFTNPNNPIVEIGNNQAANIDFNAGNPNFWADGDFVLSGNAAPLHVVKVQAAIVDDAFTPENLFVENTINGPIADSFFDIFTNVDVLAGDPLTVPLGEMVMPGQSVVVVANLGGGNYDLFNFTTCNVPEPSMVILLISLGFVVLLGFRRKRA